MYVHTYVSVMLRNVNLRSRSECRFALTSGRISDTCITWQHRDNVSWWWRTGRTVWLAMYLQSQLHKRMLNAADSSWLCKKNKKQRNQPTVEAKRVTEEQEKISKVESLYWRFFTSQVFRLSLHDTVVLHCSLINEQRLTLVPRATSRMVLGAPQGIIRMRSPSKP